MKLRNIHFGPQTGGYGGAPFGGALEKIMGGASALGPIGMGVSAVAGLAPLAYQLFTAGKQKREAEKARLMDPGYAMNNEVIRNADRTTNTYNNYALPGKNELGQQIDQNYATSVGAVTQGAQSSNDILEAAISSMYGANEADTNVATMEAQGKMSMLDKVLSSRAMAGQEYQNKNAYDRDMYQKSVESAAALKEAGSRNTMGALTSVSTLGNAFLNYKSKPSVAEQLEAIKMGASSFNYKG